MMTSGKSVISGVGARNVRGAKRAKRTNSIMATTPRQRRSLRSRYPLEHAKQVDEALARDPYYLDDTLDAYPPYHLFEGPSTPEELAAARAKAIERDLLPPDAPALPRRRIVSADRGGARKPGKETASRK